MLTKTDWEEILRCATEGYRSNPHFVPMEGPVSGLRGGKVGVCALASACAFERGYIGLETGDKCKSVFGMSLEEYTAFYSGFDSGLKFDSNSPFALANKYGLKARELFKPREPS